MVNKNHRYPSENTVINNKNIIQVCCDKPARRKRRTNKGGLGSNKPIDYLKDNQMQTQPFNLVNSFPNSTGLDMDRRARFITAMRDPNSTKSPYSIFDNGSNTFEREGNTVGAEQPVQASISQGDYFQTRQSSFFSPKLRQPQRIEISERYPSVNNSPISERRPLVNRFDDGFDDDASQASSNYADVWYREQGQKYPRTDEPEDEEFPTIQEETEDFSHTFLPDLNGPTRFSQQNSAAPFLNSPYRMPEESEEQEPSIAIETKAQEDEAENALIQAQQKIEEDKKRRADMRKQNEALGVERQRQIRVNAKYKSVIENLDNLIKIDEESNVSKIGAKAQKAQVKVADTLRTQIRKLLTDKDFTEFEGKTKNIGNTKDAKKLLKIIKDGSSKIEERIKAIDESNKDDPLKRIAPKTRGNIRTLRLGTGSDGVRSGGAASIANMV